MRRITAALALLVILTVSASAGDTQMPPCKADCPPPCESNCGNSYSIVTVAEIAFMILTIRR